MKPKPLLEAVDELAPVDLRPIFQPERLEKHEIKDLRLSGRQARVHGARQRKALKTSIGTFGFLNPVIVDFEGRVICGAARVEAARQLGMKTVPVIRVEHLSEEEIRLFKITENRIAELAEWDKDILRLEFEELSALVPSMSLEFSGFSLSEIEGIRFGRVEPRSDADAIPLHPAAAVSETGDLWLLGEHRLYCGDAREEESFAQATGSEPVQACFTDPPYNLAIANSVTSDTRHTEFVTGSGEMTPEQFLVFLSVVYSLIQRWMAVGGVAFTAMDWRNLHASHQAAASAGFELLNLCVWDKGRGGMGSLYRSQHELFHVWKKPGAAHLNTVELGKNGRNRTNVWRYEGMAGNEPAKRRFRELHPTVKPVDLIKDALLDCTRPGDSVLDPFGGSGSTLIACELIGRKARLIELDPKYVDVAIARFEALAGREAVHAGTGLTFAQTACRRAEEA